MSHSTSSPHSGHRSEEYKFDLVLRDGRLVAADGRDYAHEAVVKEDGEEELTPRALAFRNQTTRVYMRGQAPVLKDKLPKRLQVVRHGDRIVANGDGRVPLEMWYGIGLTDDQLVEYAQRKGLAHHRFPEASTLAAGPVALHLAKICRARIYVQSIFSMDHDWVVALYSNYTQERYEMWDNDEKEVLSMIKAEFHINEEAMWFHPPMGTEARIPDDA